MQVPQQNNDYDCGPFLLHYIELFIKQAPQVFNLESNQLFPKNVSEIQFFYEIPLNRLNSVQETTKN